MTAGHVSMKYGFQGPNDVAVTACGTGANSIGDAARMIQFGDANVMVAGGTEASMDALSIAGLCSGPIRFGNATITRILIFVQRLLAIYIEGFM
ncbi:3-oxoacyl-[acyl-carrier-protein] synthase, mitochondrial-like [Apium graveolens]|uniref:3-oxoacyl-[acyl-carrier-protein] synthase, mitochondrial-like n=1 Tax=Apium graveolens TaxID=4045 RepID=UPI003D7BD380